MAKVKYENVTKRFGNFTAVSNFNLEIEDHEFLCLVGPSGCGKSTTLRMLAGLDQITEGTIKIGDRIVNEVEPKDRGIAMVFQSYALYPHYNVYDNLAFGLRAKSSKKGKRLLGLFMLSIYIFVVAGLYGLGYLLNQILFGFGNTIFIAGLASFFVTIVLYSDVRKSIRDKVISLATKFKFIAYLFIGPIPYLFIFAILITLDLSNAFVVIIVLIILIVEPIVEISLFVIADRIFLWNPKKAVEEYMTLEKEIEEKISETANLLELEEQLYKKPKQLSGGQRQRVALGRAIIRNPTVFLLDEPLSNLDAKLRVQMRAELQRLSKRLGVTSIYVTHDQIEAMTLGHRIAVMNEGILQQVGTPDEVYLKPVNKFVAGFIGSPSMNFVNGKIEEKDTALYFMSDVLEYKIPERYKILKQYLNQEMILGIRPEHIQVNAARADENRYKVTIGVSEPIGSDTFIYIDFPKPVIEKYVYIDFPKEFTMIVKLEGISTLKVDEEVEVTFNTEQIHFFEKKLEKRIEP
ncbi:MAG: ABC transporter ATP-binding protein [Candidatus Thorarchaeota archaeon]